MVCLPRSHMIAVAAEGVCVSVVVLVCFFIFIHIYIFVTAAASRYTGFLYICLFNVVGICMHILLNKCSSCPLASNTCTCVAHACVGMALPWDTLPMFWSLFFYIRYSEHFIALTTAAYRQKFLLKYFRFYIVFTLRTCKYAPLIHVWTLKHAENEWLIYYYDLSPTHRVALYIVAQRAPSMVQCSARLAVIISAAKPCFARELIRKRPPDMFNF